jgi:hypothetical protein
MVEIVKLETRLCQQMAAHNFLSLLLVVVPVLPATAVAYQPLSVAQACVPFPPSTQSVSSVRSQRYLGRSQGDIIIAITEIVLGLMKQNERTRPLVREGIPTSANPQQSDGVINVMLEPRWVLDTKTDWPTEPCS